MVFEIGFEPGNDGAPPGVAFGDVCNVIELLFAIENGEEGVLEICAIEARTQEGGFAAVESGIRDGGIVFRPGAKECWVNFTLLAVAQAKGFGEVGEIAVGGEGVGLGSVLTGRGRRLPLGGRIRR